MFMTLEEKINKNIRKYVNSKTEEVDWKQFAMDKAEAGQEMSKHFEQLMQDLLYYLDELGIMSYKSKGNFGLAGSGLQSYFTSIQNAEKYREAFYSNDNNKILIVKYN